MDLDTVADSLYAGSPEEFIDLRTQRVADARAAGDRPLAKQISALRRPTRSAWLVNVLARGAADELGTLLDLGAELRDAQSRLNAAELRRLSTERRRIVDGLSQRAAELGAEQGYQATEAVRQEVAQTLQAALADPSLSEQVRAGRVTSAIAYGGFGPFGLGESPASAAPPKPTARQATKKTAEPDVASDPELERALAAAEDAAAAWQRAQTETREATDQAERTTRKADELADTVERLRAELTEAEQAEREARSAARAARKRLDGLARTEAEAERTATQAAAAVEDLRNRS